MLLLPSILLCATITTTVVPERVIIRSSATYTTREVWNGKDSEQVFLPLDNLVLNIQRTVATLDLSDGKPATVRQKIICYLTGLADAKSAADIAVGTGISLSSVSSNVLAMSRDGTLLRVENESVYRYKVVVTP